jgi:predicted secreted protein
MKRMHALFAAIAFVLIASPIWAGDVASFVNLGFSPDSGFYMFGQYGVDTQTGTPYAETFVVDTKRNDFVQKGTARMTYAVRPEPGQDPAAAFYALLADQGAAKIREYKIDPLRQGRIVYLLVNGETPSDALSFKDYKTESQWEVLLRPTTVEVNGDVTSSFGITVAITTKSGAVKRFEAGNPGIKRKGVRGYAIRRILLTPDEKTIIFIVEKRVVTKDGDSVRYMVEAVRLP